MSILAIDQGTTSTRALRIDDDGEASITQVARHRQYYPQPGWVELDPEELIARILSCVASCDDARALGIDNQGESCLAWHADSKQAISPVIVWQDNRSGERIERLKAAGHEARVLELAGLPLDTYFSASKLAWIVEHCEQAEPLLRQGKLRLGTTDAFFLDRLCNRFVTDITTASRTSLLNLKSGDWDQELCDLFRVPREALPGIVTTTGDFGVLRAGRREIAVTASVVDQQASLYGHGCRGRGDAKITFGTGAFALAVCGNQPQRSPEQGLLPTVAWQLAGQDPVYALDGGVYCAGSAIDWGRKLGLFTDYEEINQFARAPAIERDLAFVPALSGLACPHWDRRAAGLWIGMSLDTDGRDMAQSILEGVALRAAEVLLAMGEFTGLGECIPIDGGVSVNPYFCQFLANVLQREVAVKSMAELTALGTAQLAGAVNYSPSAAAIKIYSPAIGDRDYLARFREAVQRARAWR
jgi:glycerol kinase